VLGVEKTGVVGHDIGGAVMQPLAGKAQGRFSRLFFFDFVYPGIGPPLKESRQLSPACACATIVLIPASDRFSLRPRPPLLAAVA